MDDKETKQGRSKEDYIGCRGQMIGVEEHRLIGGKGGGMRLLQVRNGLGLEFTVSADRCADISRLSFKGDNFGYFAPCGYAGPQYYDSKGSGFLKSFTAGFLTTCGLNGVGTPCVDQGEEVGLHGNISHCPADHISTLTGEDEIVILAEMNPGYCFGDNLQLKRKIECSTKENKITITDTIQNMGPKEAPVMILYHMNMGYPLLSEDAVLTISSEEAVPRDEHAAQGLERWNKMEPPQGGFAEQCYYHRFGETAMAQLYNPNIKKGVRIQFDPSRLNSFVEWKMMGIREYVLGLEPGNCYPDGRDKVRKQGRLKTLKYMEKVTYQVHISIIAS